MIELDPDDGEVVWSYRSSRAREFFSHIAGTIQRLDNGNTFITQSTAGRGFEVAPDGEIVWDFLIPFRAGADQQLVAFLPDMKVVPLGWLDDKR